MSVYGPDDVGFLCVGGYNVLSDTTEVSDKIEASTDVATSLGDTWHEHAATGLKKADITQSGYFNDADNAMLEALQTHIGASPVLCYGVEGNTVGKKFIGYAGALEVEYERIASLDQLHRVTVTYRGNGQVDEGVILHALGARTTDGDSTGADSVDNAALTSDGGVGYLQVTAFSGFSSVVIKILHDTDDSGYADLLTFASVSGLTSERKTVAGTVNRHLAVDWNVTGTGSITFMVGFKRN
jgi:hypothetical protein